MEADWEYQVGGGAPGIEADWPGFVDLRLNPQCVAAISEAVAFPPLADLLQMLNGADSPLWTSKCDLWEPGIDEFFGAASVESGTALACYVDLLPVRDRVFAQPTQAESVCREWVARLARRTETDGQVDLVIRQAFAGSAEGFGITAYLSAVGSDRAAVEAALARVLSAFAAAIPFPATAKISAAKLQ